MTKQIDGLMALADEYATAIAIQGEVHDHVARDALKSALEAALKPGGEPSGHMYELLDADGCPDGVFLGVMGANSYEMCKAAHIEGETSAEVIPFYTAPPAQTPPPRLTDDQIVDAMPKVCEPKRLGELVYCIARAIETAVRAQFGASDD